MDRYMNPYLHFKILIIQTIEDLHNFHFIIK
jgi:hypothetical protein